MRRPIQHFSASSQMAASPLPPMTAPKDPNGSLHADLYTLILDYAELEPSELLAARQVSHLFNAICTEDYLWKRHLPLPKNTTRHADTPKLPTTAIPQCINAKDTRAFDTLMQMPSDAKQTLVALWRGQIHPAQATSRHPDNALIRHAAAIVNADTFYFDPQCDSIQTLRQLCRKNPEIIRRVPLSFLQQHPELYHITVRRRGTLLRYMPHALQEAHSEIVQAAITQSNYAWAYVSPSLYDVFQTQLADAIDTSGHLLAYTSTAFQLKHPELLLKTIEKKASNFVFIDDEFQNRFPEVVSLAVHHDPQLLQFTSPHFREEHPEIVLQAIASEPRAIQWAPPIVLMLYAEKIRQCIQQIPDSETYLAPYFSWPL